MAVLLQGNYSDETVNDIIIERIKLVQKEYKSSHEWVGKVLNWEMCKSLAMLINGICTNQNLP